MVNTERRVLRSDSADRALTLYFNMLSETAQCTTIALSDTQGLIISGSGDHQDLLAAYATSDRHEVSSAPLSIGGYDFVLAWNGGTPPVEQARTAVERILMLS